MPSLPKARTIVKTQGIPGLWRAIALKLSSTKTVQRYKGWRVGQQTTIEGLTFSLRSPCITPESKVPFYEGWYEAPEREAIATFLDPALPVIELGASIGVVACLTNRRLTNPQNHLVVEANPQVLPLLKENKTRNQAQFEIVPKALGYEPTLTFTISKANFLASTGSPCQPSPADQRVTVPTTTLQELLESRDWQTITLICDIEGGEHELIRQEGQLLASKVSLLILETHAWIYGEEALDQMLATLQGLGFEQIGGGRIVAVFKSTHLDSS